MEILPVQGLPDSERGFGGLGVMEESYWYHLPDTRLK